MVLNVLTTRAVSKSRVARDYFSIQQSYSSIAQSGDTKTARSSSSSRISFSFFGSAFRCDRVDDAGFGLFAEAAIAK